MASSVHSLETILEDADDDDSDFFTILLPLLIDEYANMCRKRKRDILRSKERTDRRGKKGRRWSQRKKGELWPQDFAWFNLCQHPDVGDLAKDIGKVQMCILFLYVSHD